ncbi:MAG: NAD(P)-dependent alcohol dehydrogenase [Spirochaetales bacterium]|nr:NAD(P)-dependent alcohol dehydrogenase [Spirochaetales bacterium]
MYWKKQGNRHGAIGPFVVRESMVLGHEASGVVQEVGREVKDLRAGDRVCMEPGIPDPEGRATRLGMYNLDPSVRFWATPPVHGILRPSVVHPSDFTYKLPGNVSLAEGALVEPLAIGVHAATRARVKPGDVAVVTGAGTIGMVTTIAALSAGCAEVIITDVKQPKLKLASTFGSVRPVDVGREDAVEVVKQMTGGWGADIVFEASGSEKAAAGIFELLCPGGRVVYIGMPAGGTVPIDIVAAQAKEARIDTIFRYAHVYPKALRLMGSGKIDVKPMITDTYPFRKGIEAFDYACDPKPTSVKVQIQLP